jgi:hypothetical protein
MTTLTASTTFSIGASSTVVESVQTTVLPVIAGGTGRGRLVHPTLGTYDYAQMPDEWVNVDGDVLIAPIWSSARTLDGDANTLWQGDIRDVQVEERWTYAVSAAHMRAIVAMWQNPPDPDDGYVSWYPNYTNGNGYNVILENVSVGGEGVKLNYVTKRYDFVIDDMVVRLRIVGRL